MEKYKKKCFFFQNINTTWSYGRIYMWLVGLLKIVQYEFSKRVMFTEAKGTTAQYTVRLPQSENIRQPFRQLVGLEELNLLLQHEVFVMSEVVENHKIKICNVTQTSTDKCDWSWSNFPM